MSSCSRCAAAWTSSRSPCQRSAPETPTEGCGAEKLDADRDEPLVCLPGYRAQSLLDTAHRELFIGDAAKLDLDPRPARLVEDQPARLENHAVLDFHQHRAFGARLANVAALQIARIDDEGIPAQDLVGVHMAERPILVPARREILHGARRVSVVRRPARAGSMQHADVEPAGNTAGG